MNPAESDPRGADLLAYALDPAALDPAARAAIEADRGAEARAREEAQFVAHCRRALTPVPSVREAQAQAALAARVLARTTREDLSLRGDLALCARYALSRLRASRTLRFAAAALALHFVGLSALAYQLVLGARERHLNIDFEAPPRPPYHEIEAEPDPKLAIPATKEEPTVR